MIITTAHIIDGQNIGEYLGVVSAAQAMVMPGGKKAIQRAWQSGVEETTEKLKEQAQSLGANAIISIRYEPHGTNICATGTAVKLK